MRLYSSNTTLDFGIHQGMLVQDLLESSDDYISWCFKTIDWFCVDDEVFYQMKTVKNLQFSIEQVLDHADDAITRFIRTPLQDLQRQLDDLVRLKERKYNEYLATLR